MHRTDVSDPFKSTEFVLKLSPDEKIVFADERVSAVLGFQPDELLDKSCFDFIHVDDYLNVKNRFHDGMYYICRRETEKTAAIGRDVQTIVIFF